MRTTLPAEIVIADEIRFRQALKIPAAIRSTESSVRRIPAVTVVDVTRTTRPLAAYAVRPQVKGGHGGVALKLPEELFALQGIAIDMREGKQVHDHPNPMLSAECFAFLAVLAQDSAEVALVPDRHE